MLIQVTLGFYYYFYLLKLNGQQVVIRCNQELVKLGACYVSGIFLSIRTLRKIIRLKF